MNPPEDIKPVIAFAQALDREEYDAARSLLADDCLYEFRGEETEGADAIMALYRQNGEKGRERFDRVEYESSVTPLATGHARIDYTDIVTHSGDTIVHRCIQEVWVGADGLVVRIKHTDLEGEREALAAFMESHP